MRQKYFLCFMLIGMVVSFIGCKGSDSTHHVPLDNNEKVSFYAVILETEGLLVEPKEGESELRSADKIRISLDGAIILNKEGKEIEPYDLQQGMEVEITYDGMIAESYPAQIIKCYEVKIINDSFFMMGVMRL